MNAVGSCQSAVGRKVSAAFAFLLFTFYLWFTACSIPNLEPQSCIDSRTAIREFYSQYVATDYETRSKDWDRFEKYISPTFNWDRGGNWEVDPFLLTNDWPKTFRVGSCHEITPEKAEFQLLLFWRDDVRSEQREIKVDVVKQNDRWLIDKVTK